MIAVAIDARSTAVETCCGAGSPVTFMKRVFCIPRRAASRFMRSTNASSDPAVASASAISEARTTRETWDIAQKRRGCAHYTVRPTLDLIRRHDVNPLSTHKPRLRDARLRCVRYRRLATGERARVTGGDRAGIRALC